MKSIDLQKELRKFSSPEKAKFVARYFKSGKGEYAEGDKFIGLTVPKQRSIAKNYTSLSLSEIQKVLKSKVHEDRLTALFIIVGKFKKSSNKEKEEIYNFYLLNTKYINNWDLVDSSASYLVGEYLFENKNYITNLYGRSFKGMEILTFLAKSQSLWERRIAMIATGQFVKHNKHETTLMIAKMLLQDKHDLIHKAVGWMLREVGKNNQKLLRQFLEENYSDIPRTTLRYAIEKFPKELRLKYLKGTI